MVRVNAKKLLRCQAYHCLGSEPVGSASPDGDQAPRQRWCFHPKPTQAGRHLVTPSETICGLGRQNNRGETMSSIKNAFGAAFFFVLAGALPAAAADGPANTATDAKKKVYQQKIEDSYVSAYFGVNRNLGRAWVEVASTPWIDPAQRDVIARKAVKGLYYDADG